MQSVAFILRVWSIIKNVSYCIRYTRIYNISHYKHVADNDTQGVACFIIIHVRPKQHGLQDLYSGLLVSATHKKKALGFVVSKKMYFMLLFFYSKYMGANDL